MSEKSSSKSFKSIETVNKIPLKNNKLFISNINPKLPSSEIQAKLPAIFKKFGEIVQFDLKKNQQGNYYFAFVQFKDPEAASMAIEKLNQSLFQGQALKVQPQRSHPRRAYRERPVFNRNRSPEDTRYKRRSRSEDRERRHRRSRSYQRHPSRYQRKRSSSNSRDRHVYKRKDSQLWDSREERAQDSRTKNLACYTCGQTGHFSRDCAQISRKNSNRKNERSQSQERRDRRDRKDYSPDRRREKDRRRRDRYSSSSSSSSSGSYRRRRRPQRKEDRRERRRDDSRQERRRDGSRDKRRDDSRQKRREISRDDRQNNSGYQNGMSYRGRGRGRPVDFPR